MREWKTHARPLYKVCHVYALLRSADRCRKQDRNIEYSVVQHSAVWYSTVWYGIVWYRTVVWYSTVWYLVQYKYSTVQYHTVPYSTDALTMTFIFNT